MSLPNLLSNLKSKLAWLGAGLLSILAIVLGLKLKKLANLEAKERADQLEKEVASQRTKIEEQKKGINDAEKNLRKLKSEYNHHRAVANAERRDPGSSGPVS